MKFSQKNFENWRFWKMHFFWVGHFDFFFQKKKGFFASFPWKHGKGYLLARMGQNFDQAKRDNTFWPMPNILTGSVSFIVTLVALFWSIYILRRSAGKLQKPVTNAPLFSENSFFKEPNLYRSVWRPNLIHKRGFANNAFCHNAYCQFSQQARTNFMQTYLH